MSKEVATIEKKPLTLRQQIGGDYFKQQVALALPKHMTPDRFVRVGLTALMKTPKLLDCTPESVIECMLNCSALGLEPDGRRAHLIPYGNKCTLVIDYKGLVELARRSGDVSNVFAQIVCDKDTFSWENGEIKHSINFKEARGAMYAAYAIISFKDGTSQCDVMTKDEIDKIRGRSKSGNSGPWVTDYNEMAKKTVFRRASKWITLSPEMADAYDADDVGTVNAIPNKPVHTLDIPQESPLTPKQETVEVQSEVVQEKQPEIASEKPAETKNAPDDDQIPGLGTVETQKPAETAKAEVEPPKPTEAAEPSAEEAECLILCNRVSELAVKDGVTEAQIITYSKKGKLCARTAESLNQFVAPKLKMLVDNWPHIVAQIKAC